MSIFHAIIVILFVYLVIRSLLRGRPDPIADRLVARSAPLHAAIVSRHEQQHNTFAERHTVDFNPPLDPVATASYNYNCINGRWHSGYATYEEKLAAYAALREVQGDLLAGYERVA